jgi:enoyl-CoA hydratase/carnithine racemase
MSDRVTVQITDGVADVRLNRPDKLNALDGDMFVALVDASARLARDASVRAVVLSGEGRAFSAGLDFSGFMAMAGGRVTVDTGGPSDPADAGQAGEPGDASAPGEAAGGDIGAIGRTDGRITHLAQQAAHGWSEVPVPVIAAVSGHCLGGGLQIALGADLRIVHPDATLSVLEIRWGLSPDMTATATLPRLVGIDVAKELTWTGRNVSGTEAVALGLCTRVSDDPRGDALALAGEIAAKSPGAIRGTKRLLDQSGRVPLAQQYADERHIIASLIGTPNQVEAVAAYFEKRAPSFADPD